MCSQRRASEEAYGSQSQGGDEQGEEVVHMCSYKNFWLTLSEMRTNGRATHNWQNLAAKMTIPSAVLKTDFREVMTQIRYFGQLLLHKKQVQKSQLYKRYAFIQLMCHESLLGRSVNPDWIQLGWPHWSSLLYLPSFSGTSRLDLEFSFHENH